MKRLAILLGWALVGAARADQLQMEIGRVPAMPLTVTAGATVGFVEREALPGLSVAVAKRVRSNLYAGVETGGAYFGGYGQSYAVIPLFASLEYRFYTRRLHPYLGLAGGPLVAFGSGASYWKAGFLLKPGVEITLTREMNLRLEPRLGVLASYLVFAPLVGATFSL